MARPSPGGDLSPYAEFRRGEWARLRGATPLTLSEAELDALRGVDGHVSLEEVADIYLPLSRLLNLYVAAAQQLYRVTDTFLGSPAAKVPYVIGVAGSVAGGKSTTSRILAALLARWPDHPKVDLVTTDGFLYPNRVLESRGIMHRKGFPESYDVRRLIRFLGEVKGGADEARAPVYSHLIYDIVAGEELAVRRPDILIVEGLNILQTGTPTPGARRAPSSPTSWTSPSTSTPASATWRRGTSSASGGCARRRSATPPPSSTATPSGCPTTRRSPSRARCGPTINAVNLRENVLPPATARG
jgi:type I pantothenate kinase